jgi:hypothetical protein
MTRLRCVLVWKAHSKCGTQTESVRRARSKISRSNWGLHCYRQYGRGDTRVLVGVRKGKEEKETHVACLEGKTFFDRLADIHARVDIAMDDVNLGTRCKDGTIRACRRTGTYSRELTVFQRADDGEIFICEPEFVHLYGLSYFGSKGIREHAK